MDIKIIIKAKNSVKSTNRKISAQTKRKRKRKRQGKSQHK